MDQASSTKGLYRLPTRQQERLVLRREHTVLRILELVAFWTSTFRRRWEWLSIKLLRSGLTFRDDGFPSILSSSFESGSHRKCWTISI